MNGKELLEGMSFIDDQYVHEAEQTISRPWRRWVAVAACVCLICAGAFGLFSAYVPGLHDIPGDIGNLLTGQNEPPVQRPLECNSYKELAKIVKKESMKIWNDSTYPDFKEIAKQTVEQGLVVPYLNEEPLELTPYFEGEATIALYKSDLFNRPGIYMDYNPDGKYALILVSLLNHEEVRMSQEMRFPEFLREVAPTYPNIDNITEYYTNVYEKEIELASGAVVALVLENENVRVIQFAYCGVVIMLKDKGEVFTDEWLKQADFVRTKEYFDF